MQLLLFKWNSRIVKHGIWTFANDRPIAIIDKLVFRCIDKLFCFKRGSQSAIFAGGAKIVTVLYHRGGASAVSDRAF